jgi:hypothetical protein
VPPTWAVGQVLAAADVNNWFIAQSVVKPSDESVISSTTLQFDNDLTVPITANASYTFMCYLDYEGNTPTNGDLKWVWVLPTGATLRYNPVYTNATTTLNVSIGTTVAGSTTMSGVLAAGTNGAGNLRGLTMTGSLIVGSTPGSLSLQWAQNTSSSTATIIHAQSTLTIVRVT